MDIWIRYLGESTDNYTRYGKKIPYRETKIDVCKYWDIKYDDKRKIEERINSLENDKKIWVKRHRGG